jgi:hypothetical protein
MKSKESASAVPAMVMSYETEDSAHWRLLPELGKKTL